jgi:hypothetical protein
VRRRPDRRVWAAWGLVMTGALVTLAAAALTLTDPCLGGMGAPLSAACRSTSRLAGLRALAIGATSLTIAGLVAATVFTLQQLRRDRNLHEPR